PSPQGGGEQTEFAARMIQAAQTNLLDYLGSRIVAASQTLRGGQVEPSIGVDDHAIVALRLLRGDEAVAHVLEDALRIARAWIADAGAPRQLEAGRVARRHGLTSFGPGGPAGAKRPSPGSAT